jgi:collagenase-like PrtC family protease
MKRLAKSEAPRPTVTVSVIGDVGKPLKVQIDDGTGLIGRGLSNGVLEPADRSGLDESTIRKAIGTLGNTEWALVEDIDVSGLQDGVWCPASWIKEARRQAVHDLMNQIEARKQVPLLSHSEFIENKIVRKLLVELGEYNNKEVSRPIQDKRLSVMARNYEQVDSLCQMVEDGEDIHEIIIDFLEVDGMKEAVERMRRAGVRTVVASPRIIKPNESGIWRTLLRLQPDALLVRSSGLLQRMMKLGGPGSEIALKTNDTEQSIVIPELIGDFSLNVANALTAWELLRYGCSRVTASYDLGAGAITELLETLGPEMAQNIDIVVHAHLPIFHTEHCVFARFLSNGNSYLDCGHACTRHNVHLRDGNGKDNLVLADMGCRNTVFSAEAQSGAHSLHDWAASGARHFRIELVDESAEDAQIIARGYRAVLDGAMKASNLWLSLDRITDSNGRRGGVSFGSFRNHAERRAGEIT